MRKLLYLIIIIVFIIFYFIYPESAFQAAKAGLLLWYNQILPTLLPFSIISTVLLSSGIFPFIEAKLSKHKFVLLFSFTELYIIFCGFLFGFPIGGILTSDCYKNHFISKERAQVLCGFCNNMSPIFVINYVLNTQLHCIDLMALEFVLLYGIPLIIGIIQLLCTPNVPSSHKKTVSRFQLNMKIVDTGIISSFQTLIKLCGYIVLFSIVVQIVLTIPFQMNFIKMIAIGNLEITNGISYLSSCNIPADRKIIFANLFLSIGGISGIAQTGSVLCNTDLSLKKYIITRLFYGSIIVLFTTMILLFF